MENLKQLVIQNIENGGFMNQLRAQLKVQVYKVTITIFQKNLKIIENQDESHKGKTNFQWEHPLINQIKNMAEGMKTLELIVEYLEYFKMDYTLEVLRKEANIVDPIIRENLAQKIGMQGQKDSHRPLLMILLADYLKAMDEGYSPGIKFMASASKESNFQLNLESTKKTEKQKDQQKLKDLQQQEMEEKIQQDKKKIQKIKDESMKLEQTRPQTAPVKEPVKKEPATAVNKIRGANKISGSANLNNIYGFDKNNSSMGKSQYDGNFFFFFKLVLKI